MGIVLVLVSVFIVFEIQKKNRMVKQDSHSKVVSENRVNDHLFLINERLNLQKEKIEVLHKSEAQQQGSTYEVHQENTTGVDMSTDKRPGEIVNELGREKKLDHISSPQNEIQNELQKLQAEERETEKENLEAMKKNKKVIKRNKQSN